MHGEVYNGLSYHALAQLQPCALTVQLSAEPLPQPAQHAAEGAGGEQQSTSGAAGSPPLQLMSAPEPAASQQQQQQQQQQQGPSPYSRFPAFAASAGQPLSVTITVTNHGRTLPYRSSSEAGSNEAAAGGAAGEASAGPASGLELQLEAALACTPLQAGDQAEGAAGNGGSGAAAAHELTAVWAGQLWTGMHFAVKPGQTVSQRLGLCLLAPGLFQLGLQHLQCLPVLPAGPRDQHAKQQRGDRRGQPSPAQLVNTTVSVEPCYVLCT